MFKKGKYNSGYHKTKSKIQEGKRKEKDKILIALSIFAFLLLIVVFLINKPHQNKNEEQLLQQQLQQQEIDELNDIENINEYAAFIQEGDIWINKKNWHNAIFKYSQAVELFPAKYEANYRLILAYSYNCAYTNEDCELGNELNNKFLKLFPEDENLIELEQIFKNKL